MWQGMAGFGYSPDRKHRPDGRLALPLALVNRFYESMWHLLPPPHVLATESATCTNRRGMFSIRYYPWAVQPPPPPPPPPHRLRLRRRHAPPPPTKTFIIFFDFQQSNLTAEAQAVVMKP